MADSKLMISSDPVTTKEGVSVIIAMDGSEYSNFALKFYVECLHRTGNHVILAHKTEYKSVPDTVKGNISEVVTEMAKEMKEVEAKSVEFVQNLTQRLKDLGIKGTIERVKGEPGPEILTLAKEKNVDYIVVGCRGRGKDRKTFTGSVSDYISHHSHVPVLVARNEEHLEKLHHNAHVKHPKKHDVHASHTTQVTHKTSTKTHASK